MMIEMGRYYDRDGEEITQKEWAVKFSDPDYKVVRRDTIGGVDVSTVWMGTPHGGGTLFETMFFGIDGDFQWRYFTEREAHDGHEMLCYAVRALRADKETWVLAQ